MTIQRKYVNIVLLVAAVAALGFGGYYAWLMIPPSMPQTAEEALATLASPRFDQMSESRKKDYLQTAGELMSKLDETQRKEMYEKMRTDEDARDAMREIRMDQMNQRMRQFAMATPAERNKILDEIIDQQEKMRREMEAAAASRPAPSTSGSAQGSQRRGPSEGWEGRMRERVKSRAEHGNPQRGGLAHEFRSALMARREQRGLPATGGFGPR
jgi:hypothetical protein